MRQAAQEVVTFQAEQGMLQGAWLGRPGFWCVAHCGPQRRTWAETGTGGSEGNISHVGEDCNSLQSQQRGHLT